MATNTLKILKTNDASNNTANFLIIGESGTGKTTLAGTLGGRTLILSAEAGLASVRGKSIDYVNLNVDDAGKLIEEPALRIARLSQVYKLLSQGEKQYDNIFIDSITEIAETVVSAVQKEFPDRKDSFPMWGEYGKKMRTIVKSFRDIPGYNVVMTCLSETDQDENKRRFTACDVPGRIGKQLPQFFDEVFYSFVTPEGEYKLYTKKTETNPCKDRSGKLAPIEDADLGAIMLKIFDKKETKEKK